MTPLPLLALGLRLLGIYGVFKGVQLMLSSFAMIDMMGPEDVDFPNRWHVFYAMLYSGYFAFTLSLIAWPAALARWLMPQMPDPVGATGEPLAAELQIAAYAIFGVGLIALALPSLVNQTIFLWMDDRSHYYSAPDAARLSAGVLSDMARIAIGLVLCLQGKGIVRILQHMRGRGG